VKPADISGIKIREYVKDKINELATFSKNKNIRDLYRGINEFKRGYQHRNSLVPGPSRLEVEIAIAKLEKYK
jgi:hypothetical protein